MYGKYKYPNSGFEENGILAAINEVSGTDMTALYHEMLQTTDELPYQLLGDMGLRVMAPGVAYPDTGLDLNGDVVQSVNKVQARQGLQAGDEIMGLRRRADGRSFEVDVSRNGQTATLVLPTVNVFVPGFRIWRDPFASDDARQRLMEWLKR
jgi:predicted metalloprotease with PDZ domain